MGLHLLGLGTATPPHRIEQTKAAEWAAEVSANATHRATAKRLYRRVGVRTRHSVLLNEDDNGIPAHEKLYLKAEFEQDRGPSVASRMLVYESSAGPLGIEAAKAALQAADCDKAQITHLVTVSCSGFMAPGLDVALIRGLGLPPGVQRTHVGFMGCHGALNGLRVARAFAEANEKSRVLVCAVELCSLHHQYQGGMEQVIANALFADGAAAAVGATRPNPSSPNPSWQLIDSASVLIPETEHCMSWHIRDHGFHMGLSPEVPTVIEQHVRPWLERWLAPHQLTVPDIASWAIHPGGPKILQACAKALELDDDTMAPSQEVLAEYGNMSSPTILFIVDRLRAAGRRAPCVMLAFGPGLTAEAALLVS